MYDLYARGCFGNKLREWPSFEAVVADGYAGKLGLRCAGTGANRPFKHNMGCDECVCEYNLWVMRLKIDPRHIRISESAPDECLTFQGEVAQTTRHLDLRYSTVPGIGMRETMADPKYAWGLKAKLLLEHYLDPSSLADLYALFDTYEDCTVEFSAFSIDLGCIPHRNCLVWECRTGY